ncbi:MAG: Cyclic di-GMP phosphodiesterase Gmr [Firmicutes bacterium ADurb.Bin300]|nr:MAG: Cyclic di-GMP phosphodiesterase Gmr [Firmicutes bacterium ADurb.Bin300]
MMKTGGYHESELSRRQLEMILQNTITGMALVAPLPNTVKLIYTNDGFFDMFGYTRQEYETLDDATLFNLVYYEDFIQIINLVKSGQESLNEVHRFECRILKKNGEEAYALISARCVPSQEYGIYFVCNLIDITELKKTQNNLQKATEKYEILEEISNDILFEYDVASDVLECSYKMKKLLRISPTIENAIETITYSEMVNHRDVPIILENISNALAGKRTNIFDFRLKNDRGDDVWYTVTFTTIYNHAGEATRFIGKLTNVDRIKREKTKLMAQAQTDQLTGFYNKISTGLKINDIIQNKEGINRAALFLIDIDNFKYVNDTYGHVEGDHFLINVSSKMKSLFRSMDILGRVGGDEMVLFLDDISPEIAAEKAKEICKLVTDIKLESDADYKVSCSIGIALWPDHGSSYTELFTKADEAMYKAKSSGKNNYEFYGN